MHLFGLLYITLLITVIGMFSRDIVEALRDVHVSVPHAVRRGEKAILKCFYDMEGDSLYSVKWYKGRREFYRYTPKENPAMKVFQILGTKVERSSSNESQLTLDAVHMGTSGKYSCEVSADAPSFHTLIAAGELDVVETPNNNPIITGIRPRYRVGDIVRGNCTSRHSKPAANLTWTINNQEANPAHVRHHRPLKDTREMETAISGIHFVVTPQHFIHGKLKVRCTAHIHDVYWKSTEKSIEEDHHKYSASGSNSDNLLLNLPYDQFALQNGDLIDKKDTYLTHIQGDVSSLNAVSGSTTVTLISSSTPKAVASFLLIFFIILQLTEFYVQQQFLSCSCCRTNARSNKSDAEDNGKVPIDSNTIRKTNRIAAQFIGPITLSVNKELNYRTTTEIQSSKYQLRNSFFTFSVESLPPPPVTIAVAAISAS